MTKEEALKQIREWDFLNDEERAALETLIPELAESEDERVRKEIVSALKFANDGGVYDKHIAYLEKQKELDKMIVVSPEVWDNAISDAYEDGKKDGEKHKERRLLTKEEEYTLHRIIEYLEDETCPSEWISLLHDIYCLPYEKQKEQVVDREGMYYYDGKKFIYCGYPATEEKPYDFAISQQEKQKEQEVDLKEETKEWSNLMVGASFPEQDGDFISEEDYRSVIRQTALHFYELGKNSK